jgi:hypothetical protein
MKKVHESGAHSRHAACISVGNLLYARDKKAANTVLGFCAKGRIEKGRK